MIGITTYGAYLPQMRLQKKVIADANAWFDASLTGLAQGEKAVCNWDEDVVTMAVEACTDCLGEHGSKAPAALLLASTSAPFADRQSSVVVAEALNLETGDFRTADVSASQRAGTSGLRMLYEMYLRACGPGRCAPAGQSTAGIDAQPRRIPAPERLEHCRHRAP